LAPERDIQNAILDYLELRKIPKVHIRNSGNFYRDKFGGIHFGKTGKNQKQPGIPDIVACYRGRIYLIEVKTAIGKMDDDQKDFHDTWVKEGQGQVVSILARSVDDVAAGITTS